MFGFGSASTPANTSGGFGSTSTGLFGSTPAATPGLFGATPASTPATGLFGSAQTGAPGALPSTNTMPSWLAKTPGSAVGGPAASAPATGMWGSTPGATMAGGAQASQGTNLANLTTKEGKPISYSTKWEELSPQAQEQLLKMEKVVLNTRDACRRLESNKRITDPNSLRQQDAEQEAASISQGLRSLSGVLQSDRDSVKKFQNEVISLLRDTEFAVRSFQRASLRRQADAAVASGTNIPPGMIDSLSEPPVLPIAYLKETLHGFEGALTSYQSRIDELEKILLPSGRAQSRNYVDLEAASTDGIPGILNNMHEYFVHVAAHVAKVHERISSVRTEFLTFQRKMGVLVNPFDEANKREMRQKDVVVPASGASQSSVGLDAGRSTPAQGMSRELFSVPTSTAVGPTGQILGTPQGGWTQTMMQSGGAVGSGFTGSPFTPTPQPGDSSRTRTRNGRRR